MYNSGDTLLYPYTISTANETFTSNEVILANDNSSYIPTFNASTQARVVHGLPAYLAKRGVIPSSAYMT